MVAKKRKFKSDEEEILAAVHKNNREEEKEARGGSLAFGHPQVQEVKHKNPKKQRAVSKLNLHNFMRGRDEY